MVSAMSSDNKRSDEYWMGVRDALRMVDSFNKWAKRNPGRAKDLDDFIHDGLIAAAKRCESCLSEKLGLSFSDEEEQIETEEEQVESEEEQIETEEIAVEQEDSPEFETSIEFDESPVTKDETADFEISPPPSETMDEAVSYEITPEEKSVDTGLEAEVASELSEEVGEPPSIDSVVRRDDESFEEIDIEGPLHDFSSDFELDESSPSHIESHEEEDTHVEPTDTVTSDEGEETDVGSQSDDEGHDRVAFTWAEYEAAVTPSEPESEESENDILSPIDKEPDEEPSEAFEITEPPEPPKILSTDGESSISDEEDTSSEMEEDDVSEDTDESTDVSSPPPPPPPPESEEDEEERRRRARRLFFGA